MRLRFQFSLLRLLSATTFVALAAMGWAAFPYDDTRIVFAIGGLIVAVGALCGRTLQALVLVAIGLLALGLLFPTV